MPWRGPDEYRSYPTLGDLVGRWIEKFCVIPDGPRKGQKYRLTDEMWLFLFRFYRLHPSAKADPDKPSAPFYYRGGQLMRSQKWGKSPFGAANCLAQAFGPVLFDGWNAQGEPTGRPHPSPWVQIVSTSEEQTDNTWDSLYEMASTGPIADLEVEIGLLGISLANGGKIEPRTSSGTARQGARISFADIDEPHLMTERNGGVFLATTMKRNLAGMSGRWLETTNAYDPSENSVAQRTHESPARDILVDYRPPRLRPDLDDTEQSLAELRYVYGDSRWVDVDRILADARDPSVCPATTDAMRYFFNRIEVGVSDAVDPTRWNALATDKKLQPKQAITLGFYGAGRGISVVASRLEDGYWSHLKTWDTLDYANAHEALRREVDQLITDAFAAYDVRYLFGEPADWQTYFDQWANRWPKRVIEFATIVDRRMDDAIRRFIEVFAGNFSHDGDSVLGDHVKAAALTRGQKKRPRPEEDASVPQFYLKIVKKREIGGGLISAFLAGILAESARGQAIEKNEPAAAPFFGAWR